MKISNKVAVAAAAAAIGAFSAPGSAFTLSEGNASNFTWNVTSAAGNLSGSGSITPTGIGTGSLSLAVSLTNTSGLSSNRLTAFGFAIDPDATGVDFSDINDGGMVGAALDDIPSVKAIEVCAFGGNNCSGGSNGGIFGLGGTDAFTLILTKTGNWTGTISIDPIGFKYQTGVGSFEFSSSSGTVTSGGRPVPEPSSSLVLLGLGLLGLGFARRVKANA